MDGTKIPRDQNYRLVMQSYPHVTLCSSNDHLPPHLPHSCCLGFDDSVGTFMVFSVLVEGS